MSKVKEGDIVGRKSYGKDLLFYVKKIISGKDNSKIAILKGITIRIEADAYIEDLELIEQDNIDNNLRGLEQRLEKRINDYLVPKTGIIDKKNKRKEIPGKILHLDGDKKYSEKAFRYYRKVGLNAVVKNITECNQPKIVLNFLNRYKPDVLIVTGHDGMIKKGSEYNNIYNYRNSKHFIETVKKARKWKNAENDLVIFAGACQSFFEAIMEAGANFASSPGRILIDFMDPLVVAEKIANTENYKYVSINDIIPEIRDGYKGVGGIGAIGKKKIIQ